MKMRTKLNLRFLTCLLVVGAVLGVSVHLVHGYQVKRNASVYLHMADKAKEEADTAKKDADAFREKKDSDKEKESQARERESRAKEIGYLARYLGLMPRDIDALARYGEALDDNAKAIESPRARMAAFLRLDHVLRLDPARNDIRRRQVDNAMYFGKFEEARDHLNKLGERTSKNAEWYRLKAECEAALGNLDGADGAVAAYTDAIKSAPKQIDNYWNLAVLYHERLKDSKKADAIVDGMVERGKPTFRAYLTRARYYLQFASKDLEKLEKAKKDVEEANSIAPDEPDVALAKAEVERSRESPKDADAARHVLREAIEKHPREAKLYFALITLEVRDNRTKDALKLAREGLQALRDVQDENKSDLLHALADLLVQSGDLEEADKVIARLNKLPRFSKPLLNYLRARIFFQKGKWGEASKLLEDVRTKLAQQPGLEVQSLLLLGQCYEQLGNPDQALLAYQRAHKLDPLNVSVRSRTGALLMSLKRTDEALAEYRNLLTGPKVSPEIHIILLRTLIAHNARLPRRDRRLKEMSSELNEARKATPDAAELPILEAMTILLDDDTQTDAALKVIEQARAKRPDDLNLWLASAQLCDPSKALMILEQARSRPKLADRVELRLAQLRYLLLAIPGDKMPEEKKVATEKLRGQLKQMEKDAKKLSVEADQPRLLSALAEAHSLLGDSTEAERLWKQVAQQQPNDLGIRLVLFDLALLSKSTETMARLLEEMRDIEGENGVYWRYAKASFLIREAQPDPKEELSNNGRQLLRQARQYLVEAANLRPSWPRIITLEAEIDEREGKVSAAIAKYQRALELGERRPLIVRKTVQLLFDQKRSDEINQAVRKLLADQDDTLLSAGLGKLAAVNLLSNPQLSTLDRKRAVEFARASVAEDSKSYQDHLFLGQIQRASGNLPQAEELFRRACELADNVPDTWVTLVSFLAGTGKKEEAIKAIKEAKEKIPADQAPLALASCYDSVGDLKQANENYLAALKAAPEKVRVLRQAATFYMSHGQAGQAETHLRKILQLKDKQFDDDAMWARRGLAAVLSPNPRKEKFDEALALIEANLEKDPSSLADKHAKALLLATRVSTRREAINLLEKLGSSSPLPANERFTLAQLYMAEDDWDNARHQIGLLVSSDEGKNNPTYAAYYARGLLQHGDKQMAKFQLEKLKKILPADAPLIREIEARFLRANNEDAAAIRVIREYAKDVEDLARVGLFLESLGKDSKAQKDYLAEAESMFRKHMEQSKKPERFLPLAAFLGRQHRIDDALSYCQQAQQNKADSVAVAQTITTILREGAADKQHFRSVEKWIEDMLAQSPESASLMVFLADVYDMQERFDDAERMYREALKKDPDNVIVLNNLAWLLAFKDRTRDEALAMIKKGMDLVGEGPELLDTRGVIYFKMGRADLAVKDLQEVVARAPSPNRCFHLAAALEPVDRKQATWFLNQANKRGFDVKHLHPLEQKNGKELMSKLQSVN